MVEICPLVDTSCDFRGSRSGVASRGSRSGVAAARVRVLGRFVLVFLVRFEEHPVRVRLPARFVVGGLTGNFIVVAAVAPCTLRAYALVSPFALD